jgi:16S rRNA (adenine1518-N6/adenine1519-N6)-dimethyltransferase
MLDGHRPRKRFGQHFLHDPGVIRRIVQAIQPTPAQVLVEIGPGLGALTGPLLAAAGQLEVIELDRDVVPHLQRLCQDRDRLRIHQADALQFDFATLRHDPRLLRIVGNLPYNIATPLLFHLLAQAGHWQDLHCMLQKEVAERLAAAPGSASYGRLSVMVQYRCQVEPLFNLGRGAFKPPPKVESAFLRLWPHPCPPVAVVDETAFADLVRWAFAQRRKTLRNSLRPYLSEAAIAAAGIDPDLRPERLDLAAFAALSNALAATDTPTAAGGSRAKPHL